MKSIIIEENKPFCIGENIKEKDGIIEVKVLAILNRDSFLFKNTKIGDTVFLNKSILINNIETEEFILYMKDIDFGIFDAQTIDMFDGLFSKHITSLTGVSKRERNQMSKREYKELLLKSFEIFKI